jgi:hypothetical protein
MSRNNRDVPVLMKGATAGYVRLFVIGAVTQTSGPIVWTHDGIPQLKSTGVTIHSGPVIQCLNCGKLRTDESDWDPTGYADFCSGKCERDYYSKNSRRKLRGPEARKAQRLFWRFHVVCGVSQPTGGLPPRHG